MKQVMGKRVALKVAALAAGVLLAGAAVAQTALTVGTTVLDRGSLQVITPQSTWQLSAKEFLLLYKLLSFPATKEKWQRLKPT